MEKREVRRKSTRTVPVIIENHENTAKKTKLMVPSNFTAGQLVNILRSRMHLRPYHPVYLFLKSKQSPVLMSKSIGHLHYKHRDEKGLLRLIHVGQASFGFRGNIRAIRFRQKWIENLHNSLHQDAGGPQSVIGTPPPYFPLEETSPGHFIAPLNVEDLNDPTEEMPVLEDFLYEYVEIGDNLFTSDMPSWQSSNMAGSSQSSALTNSSHSSVLTDGPDSGHLVDGLADPWLPSAATNLGQTFGLTDSSLILNYENVVVLDMSEDLHNIHPTANSTVVLPENSESAQPTNAPNPQVPPNNLSLYDSDSEFYDSDNDMNWLN